MENESKIDVAVHRSLVGCAPPRKHRTVLEGRVYDVAVATFGEWTGVELSSEYKKQFLIPKGFAHGFSVLSETAVFTYKCDEYYHPEAEAGIIYNDPSIGIDWK
ncbi:hypothetical protein EO95_14825, partial [Methanosarcina sp. 1.H.T.1A.1]|uniref:dTDP-4-dehydrorhamnose 3,5-epimerase n=1 Tax=Methanosarcina sp. 1.H.T.1A.1 TaxID=1483602 RepID=UPI000620F916